MGLDAFRSPIARATFVGVPLGALLPPNRAAFALGDFDAGHHETFDQAWSRLDGYASNSADIPPDVLDRYQTASAGLVAALDAYLASRLDGDRISPHGAQLQDLKNANDAFAKSCGEIEKAWFSDSWDDWSHKSPEGMEAVSLAQAVASEYVRASGIEFEVAERGLRDGQDARSVLAEIASGAPSADAGREAQELAEFYAWRDADGKQAAEFIVTRGGYGEGGWSRGRPAIPAPGSEPGAGPEPGGEPGGREPGGEPGGVGEPGGEPGVLPEPDHGTGGLLERGGEPGR